MMPLIRVGIVCIASASILGCGKSEHELCMDEVTLRQEICFDIATEQGNGDVKGCVTRAFEDAKRCNDALLNSNSFA